LQQANDVYWAEQVEIERLAAEGWTADAAGKAEESITLMQTAADREDASEKHVAMENRLWPMRELLGELLLALNRPAQALQAFELSLKTASNRFRRPPRLRKGLAIELRRNATTSSSSHSAVMLTAIDPSSPKRKPFSPADDRSSSVSSRTGGNHNTQSPAKTLAI
jgi:hypothetical protein